MSQQIGSLSNSDKRKFRRMDPQTYFWFYDQRRGIQLHYSEDREFLEKELCRKYRKCLKETLKK